MKFIWILCIAVLSGCASNLEFTGDRKNKRSIASLKEHEVIEVGLYCSSRSSDTTLVFYGRRKGFVEIYKKTRWGLDKEHPMLGMEREESGKESEVIDPYAAPKAIDPFYNQETELIWYDIGEQAELHPISKKEINELDRLVNSFRNHNPSTSTTEPNLFLVRHYRGITLIAEEFYRGMSVDNDFKIIYQIREKIQADDSENN